jgi:beta-lactamase superfamily II metal-dependent hydrolase
MLDRGVTLDLLVPPRRLLAEDGTGNNASIGLLMAYGDTRFLLAGDAGAEEETAWLRDGAGLRADVLKVGHHGAATSSTLAFLMAIPMRPRSHGFAWLAPGSPAPTRTGASVAFRTAAP